MKILRTLAFVSLLALLGASAALSDPIKVIQLATGTSDVEVIDAAAITTTTYLFCGFSSLETVGSNASTVRIYNGGDATGQLIFSFSLTAGESRSEGPWEPASCIPIQNGVFVDRGGSGSTLLSIYYRTRVN